MVSPTVVQDVVFVSGVGTFIGLLYGGYKWGMKMLTQQVRKADSINLMQINVDKIMTNHLPHVESAIKEVTYSVTSLKDAFHSHLLDEARNETARVKAEAEMERRLAADRISRTESRNEGRESAQPVVIPVVMPSDTKA